MNLKKTPSKKKESFDLKKAGKIGLAASVAVLAGIAIAKAIKKRSDKSSVDKLINKLKSL